VKRLIGLLDRHTGAIQALGAMLTVFIGLCALVGVKLQIDASARLQQEQSARDIYREYLSLSIGKPEFATPDYCALIDTPAEGAYSHYVEYYLYTAEQVLAADPDWEPTFAEGLRPHRDYLCGIKEMSGYSDAVQVLVNQFQAGQCAQVKGCGTNTP
jgi:hypothetical protein